MERTSKIQTHVVFPQGIIKNLICCCLLLNFLIGIKDGATADSEGPLSDEVPVEGTTSLQNHRRRENLHCATPEQRWRLAP